MATAHIQVDEGTTTNLATNTITEDAETKHLNRSVLNTSAGAEIAVATSTKQDTGNTSLASIDGKITAVNTGAVVISSSALPTGAATSAKQDTIIGHVDGIETLLGTIDADTSNISTKIDTVAGAVSGTEMQVDVLTSALPTGASTSAKQDTIIGHLDGVEGLLTTIDADTGALAAAVSGTEVQVDIVSSALPSGASTLAEQQSQTTHLATIAGDTTDIETAVELIDDAVVAADADASSAKPLMMGGMYHSSPPKVSASTDAIIEKFTQDGRPLSLTESPDSFNINNNYSSAQTNTSIQNAPGASKRLVVTQIIYSRDTAGNMKFVEDPAGTPATKFGPHYFPANGGMVAIKCYILLTANKALGITSVGGGNETITVYGITENV